MTEDITTGVMEPEISIEIRDEEDEVVAEVTAIRWIIRSISSTSGLGTKLP
jgi:hypothetical protein